MFIFGSVLFFWSKTDLKKSFFLIFLRVAGVWIMKASLVGQTIVVFDLTMNRCRSKLQMEITS